MKRTQILMDMPITVEIVDRAADPATLDRIYDYFTYVDETFSTFKQSSEISLINRGGVKPKAYSRDMRAVLHLCRETREISGGYFDIGPRGHWDPSGLVKGWAINNAAQRLLSLGHRNFYIEAGGDIQAFGRNAGHEQWRVGIRNPFAMTEIVKVLMIENQGVATSGTYIRGQHIRDPHSPESPLTEIVSLTVVGDNVLDADRFATAAFAMGRGGIYFIESCPGLEGCLIDQTGIATFTSGFAQFMAPAP